MLTVATEKTTDYIFRPVLKTRPKKKFPYRLEAVDPKKDGIFMIDNYWTAKHHMMLDVVTNELLKTLERLENNGDIFTSHFDDIVKEKAGQITASDLRYFARKANYEKDDTLFKTRIQNIGSGTCILRDKDLMQEYPFLSKLSSAQIYSLLEDISTTKFKCDFRVKLLNDKMNGFVPYRFSMWVAEPLFRVEERIVEQTKHDPPKVKFRSYMIEFGGLIGRLYAHNVKALNLIRMPVEIYSLSQDAQFIYRRFIGTMVIEKGKSESREFKVEQLDVERYMDMKVNHNTKKKERVKKALNELKEAGLIKLKTVNGRRHDFIRYEVVRCL